MAVLSGFVVALLAAFLFNTLLCHFDKAHLKAPGHFVTLRGKKLHLWIEGEHSPNPSIVFMSGSGEPAPMYNYKSLYSRIAKDNQVIVLEKFGYGYSDVSGANRDTQTVVEEDRQALLKMGIKPPYVLMPHSMSCLEALVWANQYKDEIVGIIGLDMAFPKMYRENRNFHQILLNKFFVLLGLHRLSFFNKPHEAGLNPTEIEQQKRIIGLKTLNTDVVNECRVVNHNAQQLEALSFPAIPVLQFSSSMNTRWVEIQKEYAEKMADNQFVLLECGHYLHYEQNEALVCEINSFLAEKINQTPAVN